MHLGYLHDRRDIDRTFKIKGGLAFVAETIGSKAPTPDMFEADLVSLMDSDRPIVIDLGNGTYKSGALLVKWEATQAGDDAPVYTLTFRHVIAVERATIDMRVRVATPALAACDHDECRATCRSGPCPECGPHGGKGKVLLLESWVDCLTCKAGNT